MRVPITGLLVLTTLSSFSQNIHLLEKDEAGLYKHALDSALRVILQERSFHTAYIQALPCVTDYLSQKLQGINIITNQKSVKRKIRKPKSEELTLIITCGQVIANRIVTMIYSPKPSDWTFAFWYEYDATSNKKLNC